MSRQTQDRCETESNASLPAQTAIDMGVVDDHQLETLLGSDIERLMGDRTGTVEILEAGCGRRWLVKLSGLPVRITGVDIDEPALNHRVTATGDLDVAVVGDLRDPNVVGPGKFDVVYSSCVLEHVAGAEQVLENFMRWSRDDGILVVRIPDRDTVFGFLGRILPHSFHLLYERWLLGSRTAGKPGFGPYRTVYDPVVGLKGMTQFSQLRGLRIDRIYRFNFSSQPWNTNLGTIAGLKWRAVRFAVALGGALSMGRLDPSYSDVILVMQKEPASS